MAFESEAGRWEVKENGGPDLVHLHCHRGAGLNGTFPNSRTEAGVAYDVFGGDIRDGAIRRRDSSALTTVLESQPVTVQVKIGHARHLSYLRRQPRAAGRWHEQLTA